MTVTKRPHQTTIDDLGEQVLFVAPNIRWKGGISSVIAEYQRAIATFQYQPSTTSENIVITFLSFPFLLIRFCLKLIRQPQIKIIHIHGASRGSFYRKYLLFLLARYGFKKKVIYHIHGAKYHLFYQGSSPWVQKRIQHFINTADCLIVLSDWWEAFFLENFSPRMIRVVPNIVRATKREDITYRTPRRIRLLFMGRIGERKGVYDLIETLHRHRDTLGSQYVLTLGGDGETKKLLALVEQYQLQQQVKFLGFVTGTEKERQLREADVYILPSYNEGLPISILEAMSFGMPIISTNVGGIPEVVLPHQNGILVEAGNQQAIYEAIKFFIDQPNKVEAYGRHSYDLVAQHYFPAPVMQTLADVYHDLLL